MDTPLRLHILFFENRIQELKDSLSMDGYSPVEREELVTELKILTIGLNHYRQGLEVENSFRNDYQVTLKKPANPA